MSCNAAALIGCGRVDSPFTPSAPIQPDSTRSYATQSLATAARSRSRSWMSPEATSDDLLYVSDYGAGTVDVYSYPKGTLVGTLTGFDLPKGECADTAGDIFVTNSGAAQILEYAHGGTRPIASLPDPGQSVESCSVDLKTGNLAAANFAGPSISQGSVSIYKHARGNPRVYYDLSIYYMYFCGYDDQGNLFVDGVTTQGQFVFAELPKGSSLFTSIFLQHPMYTPGNIQWDGKHVAIGDQGLGGHESEIYETEGTTGKVLHTTPLDGSCDVAQFWIEGTSLIGPQYCNGAVSFWKYPAGGSAIQTIAGLSAPFGSVVSMTSTTMHRENPTR
jgi:hypothetical protein